MEDTTIIVVCILCLIIIILFGILMWIIVKMHSTSMQISENYDLPVIQAVGSSNDHNYDVIYPLSPYIEWNVDDEDGYIEDPYFPDCDPEPFYYELSVDNDYTSDNHCDCPGACNCATYM